MNQTIALYTGKRTARHSKITSIPGNTQTKTKILPCNQSGTLIRHSEDQPIGMHHNTLGSSTC